MTVIRDVFHTYVVHLIAGRTDGSTPRAGVLQVWVDGNNTPVINMSNINTIQRYAGVTQKWMQVWEGDYTKALPVPAEQSFTLTRMGRTLAEAMADRPYSVGTTVPGQFYTGSGSDLGKPTVTSLSRMANLAKIPSSLGGNTSAATAIETVKIKVMPNYVSPNDGIASNYQSIWVYPKSPTTPWRSPDSQQQITRYMFLDPRVNSSNGIAGQDEWWMIIERNWPSSYQQNNHGQWGRLLNFHNVAGDVGWATGNGVSALAIDWLGSNSGANAGESPQFTVEYIGDNRPNSYYLHLGTPTPVPDPTPVPPTTVDFNWTPMQPVAGVATTFAVNNPVGGVTYTWDRTGDTTPEGTGTTFTYTYVSEGDKTIKLFADGVLKATRTFNVIPAPVLPTLQQDAQNKINAIKATQGPVAAMGQAILDYAVSTSA